MRIRIQFGIVLAAAVPMCYFLEPCRLQAAYQRGAANEVESASDAPPWAALVGSAERTKYHRIGCGNARNIYPENIIWFVDAEDATENGYVPAECKDPKCRPPKPALDVPLGPVGGEGLMAPSPIPPEIPKPKPAVTTKKSATKKLAKAAQPPPRRARQPRGPSEEVWKGISLMRELDARTQWDTWAAWAIEQWRERWHITPGGQIEKNTAYPPSTEQALMARHKLMKQQIEENQQRIKQLQAELAGKKKK